MMKGNMNLHSFVDPWWRNSVFHRRTGPSQIGLKKTRPLESAGVVHKYIHRVLMYMYIHTSLHSPADRSVYYSRESWRNYSTTTKQLKNKNKSSAFFFFPAFRFTFQSKKNSKRGVRSASYLDNNSIIERIIATYIHNTYHLKNIKNVPYIPYVHTYSYILYYG